MGHKVKQSLVNSRVDFFYYAFCNILLVGVPLVIISALILGLTTSHSSAEGNSSNNTSSDSLSISISSACTLSSNIDRAHTVNVNAGTHAVDIGSTRVNAYCNDNNGYSIYAIGSSNNIDGNTDLISSINDNYNIKTGIYDEGSSSSLTPSSWGMKLAPGTGTGLNPETGASIATTPPTIVNNYDNYNVVPSNYTLVASRASGTNMTINTDITGSYFTTTYDVYASSVQPAGTYNGKVKYAMVHPYVNNTDNINLERAFAINGKTKVYSQVDNSYHYTMQDMNRLICGISNIYNEASQIQLIDIRDNNLYWVAKLEDGKCWMTSNLDLDIGGANTAPLNSNNTDISTDPNVYANNGIYSDYSVSDGVYTWNPVSTAVTANYYIDNTTVKPTAWPINNTDQTTPYSAEGDDTYYYTSNSSSNDTRYNSLQACKASHTEAECKRYFAGNYYNWTAAIASNNSTNIGSTAGEIASNSICPKGWRLPNASQIDNEYNEFGRMLYKAGITAALSNNNDSAGYKNGGLNKLRSNPYYFIRSGSIDGTTLFNPSLYGGYWSSTVSSGTGSYSLLFNNTVIYLARDYYRNLGRSVRCVAR